MPTTVPARRLAFLALVTVIAVILVACGGSTPGSASPTSPLSTPAAADFDDLAADVAEADGTTVTTRAFLLITGDTAQLCGIVLESYPPQCGGPTLRVLGEIPADVLDALDRTEEPTLAQARWGWVEITGTVDATGADGTPTITVNEIRIAEG